MPWKQDTWNKRIRDKLEFRPQTSSVFAPFVEKCGKSEWAPKTVTNYLSYLTPPSYSISRYLLATLEEQSNIKRLQFLFHDTLWFLLQIESLGPQTSQTVKLRWNFQGNCWKDETKLVICRDCLRIPSYFPQIVTYNFWKNSHSSFSKITNIFVAPPQQTESVEKGKQSLWTRL